MKYFIIVSILFLGGCSELSDGAKEDAIGRMSYIKDKRTGICYSLVTSFSSSYAIVSHATVPCSPEVLALIKD